MNIPPVHDDSLDRNLNIFLLCIAKKIFLVGGKSNSLFNLTLARRYQGGSLTHAFMQKKIQSISMNEFHLVIILNDCRWLAIERGINELFQ